MYVVAVRRHFPMLIHLWSAFCARFLTLFVLKDRGILMLWTCYSVYIILKLNTNVIQHVFAYTFLIQCKKATMWPFHLFFETGTFLKTRLFTWILFFMAYMPCYLSMMLPLLQLLVVVFFFSLVRCCHSFGENIKIRISVSFGKWTRKTLLFGENRLDDARVCFFFS